MLEIPAPSGLFSLAALFLPVLCRRGETVEGVERTAHAGIAQKVRAHHCMHTERQYEGDGRVSESQCQ